MSDIKWSILINSLAAIILIISFFFTEHLAITRIILLLFVAADLLMVWNRRKISKRFFFLFSIIFLTGLGTAGLADEMGMSLYPYIFGIVLLIASYRTLFKSNEIY
ncbi:hypothetical protein U9J35_03615 [Rossellomorea aquimaris]|nr:hypothetical protein [Rossellomorea aquimaris]WRP07267.1 hypothetical protein U9J35_03615 [Rossellomorea aquimaris]